MLSLQEISDRLEIQELFVKYSHAVDTCDWDLYRSVFTTDAHIDYSAFGSTVGGLEQTVAMLAENMPKLKSSQHSNTNSWIQIDGDLARARTICFNPIVQDDNGADKITICGLWYVDTLVRTSEGWRIKERVEEASYWIRAQSQQRV